MHCDETCFEARPDHLSYGENGVELLLDNQPCGGHYCCHGNSNCAGFAAGHLASKNFYGYGRYEFRARIAHGLHGSSAPANAFTCFSVYVSKPKHNEIAICFEADNKVHFAWWYNNKMHLHVHDLPFDAQNTVATYGFDWLPSSIIFYVNGVKQRETHGPAR